MSYIGQRPVVGRYIKLDQISSGFNGSNTGFSMTAGSQAVFPGTARNLLLSLGGVIQEPDTDFTISGSTLTFTTPPVANTTFFGVIYGDMQATGTPSDGTVLPASIASSGNFSFPQLTVTSSASLLGGVVFNENGADVDFRVEGDTNAHLLFADASADKIGINESSPSHKLVVGGDIGVGFTTPNDAARQINFNVNRGSAGQTLANINWQWNSKFVAQIRGIAGADTTNKDDAHLAFFTSAANNLVERFRILSDGKVGIGTTSPNTKLDVRDPSGTGISSRSTATQATDTNKGLKVRNNSDTDTFSVSYKGQGYFAGNVGIGTTSPSSNLHVESSSPSVRLSDSDNSSAFCLFDGNGANLNIHADKGNNVSNSTMGFGIDNSIKMTLNSSGFLGIGTTSPGTRLTVSDTGPAIVDVHHSDGGTNDEARIILGALSANPPSNRGAGIAALNNGAGHDLLIKTSPSHSLGPTEKMRITSAGLVGIGTTSPVYKLEVVDASVLLKLNSSNEGNYDVRFVYQNSEANIWSYSSSDLTFGTRFAKKLHLVTNGPSKRVTIDDGGNVGIGTTSPSDFHSSGENLVVGSGSGEEGMTIYSGNSSNGVINFADSTSGSDSYEGRIIYSHSSNHMTFNVGDGAERMRIVDGGRLFVGTNGAININSVTTGHTFNQVDDYKWILGLRCELTNKVGLAIRYAAGGNDHDVIIFVKDSTVKFVVHSTGNVNNANNSYGQTSDVSLKENIVDANSQWNDIKNVKVRNFNFKAETGLPSHTQIGVVAQEIETTSPKLVTENEEGIKEVGYSVLYMKAIKALQEAMTRIETLEAEVAALKAA